MESRLSWNGDPWIGSCAYQSLLMPTVSIFGVVICPFVIEHRVKLILLVLYRIRHGIQICLLKTDLI